MELGSRPQAQLAPPWLARRCLLSHLNIIAGAFLASECNSPKLLAQAVELFKYKRLNRGADCMLLSKEFLIMALRNA